MKHPEFNKLLESILKRVTLILESKSAEYSTEDDKLHNFKRAAEMSRCTPEKALIGMWTKHVISLLDIVDHIEKTNQRFGLGVVYRIKSKILKKRVEEKITDAINYLILLEALIKERY